MSRASTLDVFHARRIVIRGVSGAGKSTAARELAKLKDVHVIDYDDDVLFKPASVAPWAQYSPDEQRERVVRHMDSAEGEAPGGWMMASCGSNAIEVVYPRTDVIVYLDYSPALTLKHLVKRTFNRVFRGERCCNGNRESLRTALLSKDSIFLWWMQTWRNYRTQGRVWENDPSMPPVYRLTKPQQLADLFHYAADVDAAAGADESGHPA